MSYILNRLFLNDNKPWGQMLSNNICIYFGWHFYVFIEYDIELNIMRWYEFVCYDSV